MAQPKLPRYFLGRADAPAASPAPDEQQSAHVVDCFSAGGLQSPEREWLVTTDGLGNLLALPDERRHELPTTIQAELAWQEMAGHRKRSLAVGEFFLFYIQLLEQPAEAPGLNDPVYLYGTLFGPYPTIDGQPAPGIEGQLTITRADLLTGLVEGAAFAFCYAGRAGNTNAPARCLHLLLPAEREDELRQGRGVVLAYPLLPPELILSEVANELLVGQLLYDVLRAIKEDLVREQREHPLREMTLPVPNRHALEQQLRSKGYEIEGNKAVKQNLAGEGFKGRLTSVFSALMSERLELPPEGKVDDFVELAKLTLEAMPDWPTTRAVALSNLVRIVAARPANQFNQLSAPAQVVNTPAPLPSRPPPRVTLASSEPATWMQDFIAAHRSPGAPQPRLTAIAAVAANAPEWTKDFAVPAVITTKQTQDANEQHSAKKQATKHAAKRATEPVAKPTAAPTGEPDWMKDFE